MASVKINLDAIEKKNPHLNVYANLSTEVKDGQLIIKTAYNTFARFIEVIPYVLGFDQRVELSTEFYNKVNGREKPTVDYEYSRPLTEEEKKTFEAIQIVKKIHGPVFTDRRKEKSFDGKRRDVETMYLNKFYQSFEVPDEVREEIQAQARAMFLNMKAKYDSYKASIQAAKENKAASEKEQAEVARKQLAEDFGLDSGPLKLFEDSEVINLVLKMVAGKVDYNEDKQYDDYGRYSEVPQAVYDSFRKIFIGYKEKQYY